MANLAGAELVGSDANFFAKALHASGRSTALKALVPLVPEVSARRYWRLTLEDDSTVVGVRDTSGGLAIFATVQRYLKARNILVPDIFYVDETHGIMLQQDLGDTSFHGFITENRGARYNAYERAIDHMLSWQRLSDDGNCPAFRLSFDVEKLMFEFDFFIEHTLLGYFSLKPSSQDLSALRRKFVEVAEELAAPKRRFFSHRDYHSRNIMIFDGKQYIIDFQDARLGLMQYDLSSLICDAYAPNFSRPLLDYAYAAGKDVHGQSRDEFEHFFRLSAYQRLVKAMGTFGRQAALGKDDFASYIAPARKLLAEICDLPDPLAAYI